MGVTQSEVIQIVTAFFGALGYAGCFHTRGKKLLFAALGGFLALAIFVALKFWVTDEPIRCFLVAVLMTGYSEGMARCLKTPTTTFLMTSLIPLIPGGTLYYTMAAIFEGDREHFWENGKLTLEVAAALALGIVLMSAVTRMFSTVLIERQKKRGEARIRSKVER